MVVIYLFLFFSYCSVDIPVNSGHVFDTMTLEIEQFLSKVYLCMYACIYAGVYVPGCTYVYVYCLSCGHSLC